MNEQVSSLYAEIGVKITGAIRGLRDFRSRLVQSQSGLKTLRDQSKITSTALNVGLAAGLIALGSKGVASLADIGVSMAVFQLATKATTEEMELARAKIAELARDASLPKATLEASSAALSELGKAGLSARDAIDALRPTMLLAAAGGLEAGDAAQILSAALLTFKLPGTEAARVADLLAGAEIKAAGSVRDHAAAMQQAGAVFALAGVPIEDLVTSIALLANNGILGADAGTALKSMMLKLIAPTEEAAGLMRGMGVAVYDAQGKMKPFREIIEQFQKGLAPLTDAQKNQRLETIFGSDAVRAAAIIFGKDGVQAFDTMKTAVTEVGLAQQLATAKTDGLGGALENVSKAINTASVDAVKPFEESIIAVAKAVSNTILWFDALDPPVKNVVLGVLAAVVALGALAGAIALTSAVVGVLSGALLFLAANPIVLLVLLLAGLVAVLIWAYNTSDTFRYVVDRAFSGIGVAASAMWNVVKPIFDGLGGVIGTVATAVGNLLRLFGLLPSAGSIKAPVVAPSAPNYGVDNRWAPPTGGISLVPGRAGGGSVAGGSSYMVGERGPELFTPGRSGSITANGAGGATINNNFYGPVFGFSDLKDLVVRAMNEAKLEGRT